MRTVEEDAVPGEGNTANVPSKAPQAEPDMLLNLSVVLPYMAYRKRIRYFTGEYKASNPYRMAFLLLILLFLWSLQSFFLQQTDQELNFGVILSLSYSMPEGTALGGGAVALNAINYGLMIVCLVLVSVHVTTFESPFITMMGLVAIVLFLVVLGRRLDFSQNHSGDIEASSTDEANAYSLTQDVIMQAFVYLSLLHMLGSAIIRRLVPWLVRRNSILACAGILDRRDLVDPATATALIALPPGYSLSPERRLVACYLRYMEPWYMWWLPIVGRETITFVGEVDGSGHPSGYGEWRDSAWHGEHLTGFWHAGKPAGPFRSRETGSASSLVNLRVAYFRNRGEAIGRAACLPKLTPLQFGIVACEVTTSGVWFKSLPRLRELLPPIDIAEGLEAEREAAEAEGRLPAAAATAAAAAARATSRWRWWPWRGRGKGGASGERVAGHGNGPSDDPQQCAVAMLGPEHTSGNLPGLDPLDPNALPPTLPPTSVDAAGGGAAGACVGRGGDLSRPPEAFLFVHGLGVDLHKALRHYAQMMALLKFPPHISPMLFAWPSSIAVGYFFARYRAAERPETGLALASAVRALAADGFAGLHILLLTVTICNPDYGLRPFVREMGFRLRALCPIVTIYGDTADGALGLSEVVNAMARPVIRTRRWMRYMLGRGKRGRRSQAQGVGEQCQPAGQPEQGGEAAASGVPAQVVAGTGAGAGAAAHTKGRTGGHQQSVSPDEGKRVYQITDPVTRVPLDLDVIDLSFLASNVNAMRHTHFALNREMLDDLYDVVVLRRRARERMWRLEHITGNVFSIAVCPYYISTKNL
eukprot:XP_001695795.1 predicted protein [Chlamydomonas reinhardtii]